MVSGDGQSNPLAVAREWDQDAQKRGMTKSGSR